MSPDDDVTGLIRRLKNGDREAAGCLWETYVRRVIGLARKKLRSHPRRAADEDDVAQCVFYSFCWRAEQDGFAELEDRDDLWQILALITTRKVADLVTRETAPKRGGGKVGGHSAFPGSDDSSAGPGIEQMPGRELSPAETAELVEEYRHMLDELGDDRLRQVARWKLEGHTNEEIAEQLECAVSTVERKLVLIRDVWKGRMSQDGDCNGQARIS
jgi:DNA-directed RNA polymerase specialized sigma24 family protein